ncbi:MAG: hypothetical protein IKS09_01415, partial [Lachnospiraceae bacterium]|nr:hypothetical protein [Lachnospiraceae bacterium]
DSETARFLTEDTYRGEKNDPLSLNLYTYCKNNPLKYTDPTGHSGMVIAKIVATLTEIVLEVGFTAFTIEKILKLKKDISQTITAINSNKEKSVKNEKKSSEVKKKDAESEKHSQNSSESNNQNQSGNKRGNNNSANNPPKDSSHSEKYEIIERNTKTSLTVKYNGSDTSLYRGGNSFEVRPADIRIDPNTGLVQPTHGLSVNVDPNAVVQFGGAYRIDELPKGLTVIQRGNRPGHFEIVPEYPMPIDIYQYLLRQIKVSKNVLR